MGLYFMKEPPKFSYRNSVFINPRMKDEMVFAVIRYRYLEEDAVLTSAASQ